MTVTVTYDGVEYTPSACEEEHGWCWCTDDQHGHHAHPRLGWGPVWCGDRRLAEHYRIAVLNPADRKGAHRVTRRHLVMHTAVTKGDTQ